MGQSTNHISRDDFLNDLGLPAYETKYNFASYIKTMIDYAKAGNIVSTLTISGLIKVGHSTVKKWRKDRDEFAILFELCHSTSAVINAQHYNDAAYNDKKCNAIIAKDIFDRTQKPLRGSINIRKSAQDLVQDLTDALLDEQISTAQMKEIRESIVSLESLEALEDIKKEVALLQKRGKSES